MAYNNTPSAVHLDEVLTGLTLSYMTEQNFIADKIFPAVEVSKVSDKFYKFDPDEENREGDVQLLAPRTAPPKIEVSSATDTYFAEVYALAADFDQQTLANADDVLELRMRKVRNVMNKMLMKKDRDFLNTFFTTGVWGEDLAGGTNFVKWSDAAAVPIDNMRTWKRDFQLRNYGIKCNKVLIPQRTIDTLMANAQILGRINGGATIANPAMIDMTLLANIFGVEEVIVMDAVSNTAKEGATGTPAFMAGDSILLTYSPADAGLDMAASGLNFAYNSIEGVSYGISVESFTDEALQRKGVAEEVQAKMAYDMKVVGPSLGTFINDVL